jgi:hypothetical protein
MYVLNFFIFKIKNKLKIIKNNKNKMLVDERTSNRSPMDVDCDIDYDVWQHDN